MSNFLNNSTDSGLFHLNQFMTKPDFEVDFQNATQVSGELDKETLELLWREALERSVMPAPTKKQRAQDDANRAIRSWIIGMRPQKRSPVTAAPPVAETPKKEAKSVKKSAKDLALEAEEQLRLKELEKEKEEKLRIEQQERENEFYSSLPCDLWVNEALRIRNENKRFIDDLIEQKVWANKRSEFFDSRSSGNYLIEEVINKDAGSEAAPNYSSFVIDAIEFASNRLKLLEKDIGYKPTFGLNCVGKYEKKELSSQEMTEQEDAVCKQRSADIESTTIEKGYICESTYNKNSSSITHSAECTLSAEHEKAEQLEYNKKLITKAYEASLERLNKEKLITERGKTNVETGVECSHKQLSFLDSHPFCEYTQRIILRNCDKNQLRFRIHASPSPLVTLTPLTAGLPESKRRRSYDPSRPLVSGETLEMNVTYRAVSAARFTCEIKVNYARELNTAKAMNPASMWKEFVIPMICTGPTPELELVTNPRNIIGEDFNNDVKSVKDINWEQVNPGFTQCCKLRDYIKTIGAGDYQDIIRRYCFDDSKSLQLQEMHPSKGISSGDLVKQENLVVKVKEARRTVSENCYTCVTPCVLYSRVIKRICFYNSGSDGEFKFRVDAEEKSGRNPFSVFPNHLTVQSGEFCTIDIIFQPRECSIYTCGFKAKNVEREYYGNTLDVIRLAQPLALQLKKAHLVVDSRLYNKSMEQPTDEESVLSFFAIETAAVVPIVTLCTIGSRSLPLASQLENFYCNKDSSSESEVRDSCIHNRDLLSRCPALQFCDASEGHIVQKTICLLNCGPLSIDYVWDMDAVNGPGAFDFRKRENTRSSSSSSTNLLRIESSCGTLKPNSETIFQVFLTTLNEERVEGLLKLFLLGLPDPSLVCFDEEVHACSSKCELSSEAVPVLSDLIERVSPCPFLSRLKPVPALQVRAISEKDPFMAFAESCSKNCKVDSGDIMDKTSDKRNIALPVCSETMHYIREYYYRASTSCFNKLTESVFSTNPLKLYVPMNILRDSKQRSLTTVMGQHIYPSAFVNDALSDEFCDQDIEIIAGMRSPLYSLSVRCVADPFPCVLYCVPDTLVFHVPLLIGVKTIRKLQLFNKCKKEIKFALELDTTAEKQGTGTDILEENNSFSHRSLSNDEDTTSCDKNKNFLITLFPESGSILAGLSSEIVCSSIFYKPGVYNAVIKCSFFDVSLLQDKRVSKPDGICTIRVPISAEAVGASITVDSDVLDFGVVLLHKTAERRLNLINNNPFPVTFYISDPDCKDEDITKGTEKFTIQPSSATLRSGQSINVTTYLRGIEEGEVSGKLKIAIEDGKICYVTVRGLVQAAAASLTPSILNFGSVHKGVPAERKVLLKNFSSIELEYSFKVVEKEAAVEINETIIGDHLKDIKGTEPPHVELPPPGTLSPGQRDAVFTFRVTFFGQNITGQSVLVLLFSPQLERPVPLEIICTEVCQLSVSVDLYAARNSEDFQPERRIESLYENIQDSRAMAKLFQPLTEFIEDIVRNVVENSLNANEISTECSTPLHSRYRCYSPSLKIPYIRISDQKPFVSTVAILRLKNHSGCITTYRIASQTLCRAVDTKDVVDDFKCEDLASQELIETPSLVNTFAMRKSLPALRSAVDYTFQVKLLNGEDKFELLKMHRIMDAAELLIDGKGCSLQIEQEEGPLGANAEVNIPILVMANVPGKYTDRLRLNVEGLPPVDIDLYADIRGQAVVLDPSTCGFSPSTCKESQIKLSRVLLPTLVSGLSKITRRMRLINRCPRDVEVALDLSSVSEFYRLNFVSSDSSISPISVKLETAQKDISKYFQKKCDNEENKGSEVKYASLNPSNFVIKSMEESEFVFEFDPPQGSALDLNAVLLISSRIAKTTFNDKFLVDEYYRKFAATKGFVPFTRQLKLFSFQAQKKNSTSLRRLPMRLPLVTRSNGVIVNSEIVEAEVDEMERAEQHREISVEKSDSESDETSTEMTQRIQKAIQCRMEESKEREAVRDYVSRRREELVFESQRCFDPIELQLIAKNIGRPVLDTDPPDRLHIPFVAFEEMFSPQNVVNSSFNARISAKKNEGLIILINNTPAALQFHLAVSSSPPQSVENKQTKKTGNYFFLKSVKSVLYDAVYMNQKMLCKMPLESDLELNHYTLQPRDRLEVVVGVNPSALFQDLKLGENTLRQKGNFCNPEEGDAELLSNIVKKMQAQGVLSIIYDSLAEEYLSSSEQEIALLATLKLPHLVSYPEQLFFRPMHVYRDGHSYHHLPNKILLYNFSQMDIDFSIRHDPSSDWMRTTRCAPGSITQCGSVRSIVESKGSLRILKETRIEALNEERAIPPLKSTVITTPKGGDVAVDKKTALNYIEKEQDSIESSLLETKGGRLSSKSAQKRHSHAQVAKDNPETHSVEPAPVAENTLCESACNSLTDTPEAVVSEVLSNVNAVDDPTHFIIYPESGRVPAATPGGKPGTLKVLVSFVEEGNVFFKSKYKIVLHSSEIENHIIGSIVLRGESSVSELNEEEKA